jgi:hypothetical protein
MIRLVVLLTVMHLRGGKQGGTTIDYSKWNGLMCSSSVDSESSSNSDCNQHGNWPRLNCTVPKLSNEPQHAQSFSASDFNGKKDSAVCKNQNIVSHSQNHLANRSRNVLLASRPLVHSSKRRKYLFKDRVVSHD